MGFRNEVFALAFGVLLVLVTFGDNHLGSIHTAQLGNLDAIFGLVLWPAIDLIYSLATVAVFLLYGWSKEATYESTQKHCCCLLLSY